VHLISEVNAESSKQHDPKDSTRSIELDKRGEYLRTNCGPVSRAAPVESPRDAENLNIVFTNQST
jgi:hypothetical protein